MTKRLLGYFQGATPAGAGARPGRAARRWSPSASAAPTTSAPIIETLADEGSVTFLRERFAPEMVTALARIEGRPVGVIANNTMHMAGAITSDAADKAARFMQLCDAFGLPIVSLVDTPGDDGRPRGRGDRPRPPRLAAAGRRRARCACRSSR